MPNFSLVFLLLQRPSGLAVATGLAALAFFPIPSSAQAPPERPQADERADAQPARVPRHGLWVEAAFASGVPDRRDGPIVAWFGPWSTAPAALRDYNRTIDNDREYAIGATYRYGLTPRLTIGGGLAVARLGQDFRTVFDYGYFFEDENRRGQNVGGPDDIPYRSDYRTYLLQVAPEVAFTAWRWRRLAVGASVQGRYSWTFYKVVNNGGNALWLRRGYTEYVGEPFAVEVYPGVYAAAGPVRLDVQYRALHRKYLDDSALNNGLRVDPYNPAKWRLALSYRVARWGRGKQAPASEKMDKT